MGYVTELDGLFGPDGFNPVPAKGIPVPAEGVIGYQGGRAVSLSEFSMCNGYLARSDYEFFPFGKITEWHQDPEHGDWSQPEVMSEERVRQLRGANRGILMPQDVLGKSRAEVEVLVHRRRPHFVHIDLERITTTDSSYEM